MSDGAFEPVALIELRPAAVGRKRLTVDYTAFFMSRINANPTIIAIRNAVEM